MNLSLFLSLSLSFSLFKSQTQRNYTVDYDPDMISRSEPVLDLGVVDFTSSELLTAALPPPMTPVPWEVEPTQVCVLLESRL